MFSPFVNVRLALVTLALAAFGVIGAAACGSTEIIEVPGETVVVEVEVPGETMIQEVIREVEVPGETIVVEKVVVQEAVAAMVRPVPGSGLRIATKDVGPPGVAQARSKCQLRHYV